MVPRPATHLQCPGFAGASLATKAPRFSGCALPRFWCCLVFVVFFWALHVCPLPRDPILHLDRCVLSHFHRLVALFKTAAMSWTAEMVCRLSSGLMRAELDVALRGDILKSSYNDEFGTRMQTC